RRGLYQVANPVIKHSQRKHVVAENLTERQLRVPDAREEIEPFCRPANGIGHDLGGNVRGVDAMSGIALKIIEVWRDSADSGNAIAADRDRPAPWEFAPRILELRKTLDHARPHHRRNILRITIGIVATAAEQHSPISRHPEIIEHDVAVCNGK